MMMIGDLFVDPPFLIFSNRECLNRKFLILNTFLTGKYSLYIRTIIENFLLLWNVVHHKTQIAVDFQDTQNVHEK